MMRVSKEDTLVVCLMPGRGQFRTYSFIALTENVLLAFGPSPALGTVRNNWPADIRLSRAAHVEGRSTI